MSNLRPSGGYRCTASFQTATIIYDGTWWFCEKVLDSHSRTVDQMIQAARSGRQNIVEGSRASATSSQTELRLMNVARSSLEELLLDFEDYLRHRHLPMWKSDSPEAMAIRRMPYSFRELSAESKDISDAERWHFYAAWLEHADSGVRANALICLIHQANFLLDQQIRALEKNFIEGGGYSERLAAARLTERAHNRKQDCTDTNNIPQCPVCGKNMVLRTAKTGKNANSQFWGCSAWPNCKGIVDIT